MKGVATLIRHVPFGALLADQAFKTSWLLEEPDASGAMAVISPKANRKHKHDYDAEAYKWWHLVANCFPKIKEFRGIPTRFDKTDCSYAANGNLAAALAVSR